MLEKQILVHNGDGSFMIFDRNKIEKGLEKFIKSINNEKYNEDFIDVITDEICKKVSQNKTSELSISDIDNITIDVLFTLGEKDLFRQFVIFRDLKDKEKVRQEELNQKKIENNTLKVTKRNGKKELLQEEKIRKVYNSITKDIDKKEYPYTDFYEQLKKFLVDGIKTKDLGSMMIKSCIDQITPEKGLWKLIAGRLILLDIYKEASLNRGISLKKIYSGKNYQSLFLSYIKKGNYYKKFMDFYSEDDLIVAGNYINKSRDFDYDYNTMLMLKKRYLLNPNKKIAELPQEMYMSIALFLAIPEKPENRLSIALKFYDACSSQEISLPTPTLLNARTNFNQLSSCFKISLDDDLRGIYHGIENMAQISKFGGGIGTYLGNIRSKGGSIRGVNGASGGVAPFIKVINDTAIAVNQLGARAGAISVTLDIWHRDIYDFLDLQTETGDIRRKSFDIFPAVSIPDLFMERVENNQDWSLFDPQEVLKKKGWSIQDFFGDEFKEKYIELENTPGLKLVEKVNAKELFKKLLKSVVETGMPYVFFRDTVNRLNPNKHKGNIYSTQLCVEINQNTSPAKFKEELIDEEGNVAIKYTPGDLVVCNLASINVSKVFEKEHIERTIPLVMRILDNVIDLNFYPVKEAEITAMKYRSVGLGFLGLAELLAKEKHLSYDSPEAREYVDKLFEKFAYETLKASNQLAEERGKYPLFDGSDWSKGIILGKDEKWFKENSKISDDWSELIENIKEKGTRFAYHLAPAPNTSTALVVGTTASILPIYKKYYVETNSIAPTVNVAPGLNQENFWYYKEYVNMNMNDVIDMVGTVYKWIDQSVSFEWIINPQKVSPKELYEYYFKSWKKGIKTVYYVRSMSLEVTECVSCSG